MNPKGGPQNQFFSLLPNLMSCPLCLDLLRYPVALSCGHNMCKACILGCASKRATTTTGTAPYSRAHVSLRCPRCSVTSSFESEAHLVVNKSIQAVVDVLESATEVRIPCMRCEAAEATADCADCDVKFCSACSDLVHVGRLKWHRVSYDKISLAAEGKPKFCSVMGHSTYRTDLFCTDCKAMHCVLCSKTSNRHASHHVVALTDAAEVEKVKLLKISQQAEQFKKELKSTVSRIDQYITKAEQNHEEEELVFLSSIQKLMDQIVAQRDALLERSRSMTTAQVHELRKNREQVLTLAAALNESIALSRRAIYLNATTTLIQRCADMEHQLSQWEPVVLVQPKVPQFVLPHFRQVQAGVESMNVTWVAVAEPSFRGHDEATGNSLLHLAAATDHTPRSGLTSSQSGGMINHGGSVIEPSVIFSQKPFRFFKSTYNELTIAPNGLTVTSHSSNEWETAMGDAVLTSGRHYFELQLDRYDPQNGHNIVLGVVFDGPFELCEIIGEDEHSVGFDVGRGTKCVAGDYSIPYALPAPSVSQGDVIGVEIDFSREAVAFYWNGKALGEAFTGLNRPCYAAVSLINNQQVTLMFPVRQPY